MFTYKYKSSESSLSGCEADSTCASWNGPAFVRGEGCWLIDDNENRYFDASAGSGALNLGHCHPDVVNTIIAQSKMLIHTGCKVQSDVRQKLIENLGQLVGYENPTILPTVIGTEAVEAALKIVRAATGRRRVIALERSYHGKSTGALSLTWCSSIKRHAVIDAKAATHCPAPLKEADVENCLDALSREFLEAEKKGDPIAAIFVEPVQSTEGVWVLGAGFLCEVAKIAEKHGALVVFDEIYTGFGRCGTMFYYQQVNVKPDLLIVGKALANGIPIGAVAGSSRIVNALEAGVQTSTFSGHPLACAAALAVLDLLCSSTLISDVDRKGALLRGELVKLAQSSSCIANIRGTGLLIGFDCVDEEGRPSSEKALLFSRYALESQLVCNVGGHQGASVRLTPPLTITYKEMKDLIERIDSALQCLKH